ncbi:DUF433 domain-containing protein [Sporichthya sp.]|uniref:DUF433 domain-containing protein n=1 Tax=Sporichthya sp. TaxID=65475 RepID=UPI00183544D9|nr:DUF433 domain-containing protein [Sporichthya sp.]MBA3741610.1 DUF433 domain-containing protein [Sporichthya sp.]
MAFERISRDPDVMGGVPCITGTRIPVATVLAYLAEGQTPADLVRDFPQLIPADVVEVLGFAAGTAGP